MEHGRDRGGDRPRDRVEDTSRARESCLSFFRVVPWSHSDKIDAGTLGLGGLRTGHYAARRLLSGLGISGVNSAPNSSNFSLIFSPRGSSANAFDKIAFMSIDGASPEKV